MMTTKLRSERPTPLFGENWWQAMFAMSDFRKLLHDIKAEFGTESDSVTDYEHCEACCGTGCFHQSFAEGDPVMMDEPCEEGCVQGWVPIGGEM